MKALAPNMTSCYLWLDYSCLNQNSAMHSVDLSSIMAVVDCVFTPVIGEWSSSKSLIEDWANDYNSANWNQETSGYIHRAW